MNGNGRIFKKIQGKKNIYEEYQIKGGKQTETVRTVEITKNGSTGDITEKYSDGTVRIFYKNGNVYEGNFVDGKRRTRKGKYTVAEKETKKPLYTEVYDEKGIMTAVEYVFVEGNKNRIVVNYDEINKALNIGKIRDFEDLITKGYIWLCDKDGNKIKNPEWFDFNKVIECAKYQMQTRLKGSSNDLDDEKIIE